MGYGNVAHLEGGFAAWRAVGEPVEHVTKPSHEIADFTGIAPRDSHASLFEAP
jgi:3-mercaptopyruvate sulfurtransferase SseA